MFQHNLLIVISEITDNRSTGTWKNVVSKINKKIPDSTLMQNLSLKSKISSVKIANFKGIIKATICKQTVNPILAGYDSKGITISVWNPNKSCFESLRKVTMETA